MATLVDLTTLLIIGIALTVFAVLVTGCFLVVRDTLRGRGRWGINVKPAVCLQCNTPAPAIRRPENLRQALWGGWTCPQCGYELDKWGHPVAEQPFPAKWSAYLEDGTKPAPPAAAADDRLQKPNDESHRGDIRG